MKINKELTVGDFYEGIYGIGIVTEVLIRPIKSFRGEIIAYYNLIENQSTKLPIYKDKYTKEVKDRMIVDCIARLIKIDGSTEEKSEWINKESSKKLDQFYTSEEVAKKCISYLSESIDISSFNFVEPSAGRGVFSNLIKETLSFDIDPKAPGVIKKDFLLTNFDDFLFRKIKPICFFGNPPFGKNSSLAISFFNHSSIFGDVIAFIIPKTFRKASVHNKLSMDFHLDMDVDLPKDSFVYNGSPYDVPCCFQVWIRKNERRQIKKYENSSYFDFTKKEDASFAVRRVGGRAGMAFDLKEDLSPQSNYFLKLKDFTLDSLTVINIINSINLKNIVSSTAGVRSLSKGELIEATNEAIDKVVKNV